MLTHFFNQYILIDNKHHLCPLFQIIQYDDTWIPNKYWIELDSPFVLKCMPNQIGLIIRFGMNTESSRNHYPFSKRILKRVGLIFHFRVNSESSSIHYPFSGWILNRVGFIIRNGFWINIIIIHEKK